MKQATASTRAFGDGVMATAQKHQQGFTTIGLGAMAMGGAMLGAFALATKAAIDFESSFAGVRKTVDATEAEFAVLSDGLRQMATEIPVNVHELNRIAEAAGQLGIEKGSILSFTRVMADLGVATNLTSEQAAESLARLANIMQTPASEFEKLGATVVDLGNKGAATESEIVEMGLRIAGAGQQVGLTEAQVLGFAEALSSVGIEAEAGGSALSRVMSRIALEVDQGGEKLEQFAAVAGMSADEFTQAYRRDAAGAIITFVEGLGRMDASGDSAIGMLQELGLTEIRVRDALLRMAGAGDLARTSQETANTAYKEGNALQIEAEKRYSTTASKIQVTKNKINEAAIAFGETMLPAVRGVSSVIGVFADGIGALPGPLRTAAMALAAVGGAMLLVGGAGAMMLPRVGQAKEALAAAGKSGGILKNSLKSTAGFLMSPWGLALAGATMAMYAFGASKADAAAKTQVFTDSLDADSGSLGQNTAAALANMLQQEGLLETFKEQGRDLGEVIDTMMGAAEGRPGDIAGLENLYGGLSALDQVKFGSVEQGLLDARTGFKLTHEAAGGTGDAVDGVNEELNEFTGAAGDAATAADILTGAFDELSANAIDAEQAAIAWRESIRGLKDDLQENGTALRGNSAEADANKKRILESIEAAKADGAAIAQRTGSVERGAQATQRHIQRIKEEAAAAGISKGAINAYIASLNLTPKEIRTAIKLLSRQGEGQVARWKALLGSVPRRVTTIMQIRALNEPTYPPPGTDTDHAGGLIGQSGARRYHAGGLIGVPTLRGDEEFLIGQRGERMLSRPQNRAYETMLAGARTGSPRSTAAASPPNLQGLELRGVLDTPFGPSEIRGEITRVVEHGEAVRTGARRAARRRRKS